MLNITAILVVALMTTAPGALPTGQHSRTVCVPPTMPPFLTWDGGPAQPLIGEDHLGRPVLVIGRVYSVMGKMVRTFWVRGQLISVDPKPDDPAQPLLHDLGLLTADGKIRGSGTPSCEWSRLHGTEEVGWR